MGRRSRRLAIAVAVLGLGAVVAAAWMRLLGPRVADPSPTAVASLRKLAELSPHSRLCDPAPGKGLVCSASGLRVHGGQLWLVMDGPLSLLARAPIATKAGGELELSGPHAFVVEAVPDPPSPCEALHDIEAIAFSRDGTLVVTTDDWQVAWFEAGPPLKARACRQYEALLPANHGLEAAFTSDGAVHAITEHAVQGRYLLHSEILGKRPSLTRFVWKRRECEPGEPRITDAVELGNGALLLASCRRREGGYDYFLGRLERQAGGGVQVRHVTPIDNPLQRNLEGLERLPTGRLLVVNDDSVGDVRQASTDLWEIVLPQRERKALGL